MDADQDRFQRQARRQSVWREEMSSASPFQSTDPFAAPPPLQRPRRADTGISPLEPHPGRRLPSIKDGVARRLSYIAPDMIGETWTTPFQPKLEDVQETSSVQPPPWTTVLSKDIEDPLAPIERAATRGRTSTSHLTRLINLLLRRSPVRRRGHDGLHVASAIATAHVPAFLKLNLRQGLVYISEYEKGKVYASFVIQYADWSETDTVPYRVSMPFNRVSSIQEFLDESTVSPALRVIYVYNNEDAMDFLTDAFCVDHPHFQKSERSFRDWVKTPHANRAAFDQAVAWRPAYDLAREVTCTVFGMEFGHELDAHIARENITTRDAVRRANKKLSSYQRLSVYMQRYLAGFPQGARMDVFNSGAKCWQKWAKENTVLIYESASGEQRQIVDPIKLQSIELHHPGSADEWAAIPAAIVAIENVLTHVLDSILKAWRRRIIKLSVQHEHLEDRVYERPSDDSHAGGLWGMSQHALGIAKLVNRHSMLCQDVREYFNHFAERTGDNGWLEYILKGFRETSHTIEDDFIHPTDYMIDLMYKSISIRDSRQSLELNASLWRLSWITFIFLPLTFLVGFFGMNVDTFNNHPSMSWYWVAAVPMMIIVVGLWFLLKQFMPQATRLLRYTEAELDLLRDRPG